MVMHQSELGQELNASAPVLSLLRDINEEAVGNLGRSKIQGL
jgi:hypothetical protein